MPTKSRGVLYSREAAEILRIITTYRTLKSVQIYRLFPGRGQKIQTILSGLINQGRVFYDKDSDCVAASEEYCKNPDSGMIAAFWVLLDFIDRAEYHTASDFPVKISFFADGEMYEVVHVPRGHETMITHTLTDNGDIPRRIVLVDDTGQIAGMSITNTAGFCVVASDGAVSFYQRKLE